MDKRRSAPSPDETSRRFLETIPRDFAREHGVLSCGESGGTEVLAITAATSLEAVWNIGVRLGHPVITEIAETEDLQRAIDLAYEKFSAAQMPAKTVEKADGDLVIDPSVMEEDLDTLLNEANRDLLATEGKAPLVRLVDRLLFTAVQIRASDLHIQPTANHVLVRHRIDGVLDQGRELSTHLLRPLVSRIKVMGRMDVAERLVPQDGRTTLRLGQRSIDVRISTIPSAYGERVVLRLLDSGNQLFDLSSLGMPEHISAPFTTAANRSSGIILVTGPTGSGKTTTLYATLRSLNAGELNVMTIEDPIEYELSSLGIPISQSQVNLKKGVNFANGLRHILRQDPDVIMVGEIRDAETARVAIQASLTGHLVFSTLHTNDALSAITRLIDLGIEPYLVASSLSVVIAQRLVRRCCPTCRSTEPSEPTPSCPTCHGNGFQGRIGLFEVVELTEAMRSAISAGASRDDLRRLAGEAGMCTLFDEGAKLVESGLTTTEEVHRVIHHG